MKGNVLIVDDNLEIIEGAKYRLRSAGYEVITTDDGCQTVGLAVTHQPDAIVLDLLMPTIGGLKVLEELKSRPDTKQIPVVVVSGSVQDEQPALKAGARFFLRKPFQGASLVTAIEQAISTEEVITDV